MKRMIKKWALMLSTTIWVLLLATGFSATAFAYVEPDTETEQVVEVTEPEPQEMTPFTVAGNGEVEDDIAGESSKEFLTIKTKEGSTFFLIIDRARDNENVYMLAMIDAYDLQEFLEDEERSDKEEAPAVVIPDPVPEPAPAVPVDEPEEPKDTGNMTRILALIFAAALAGAAAFFYFYIYKPKQNMDEPQSENMETDESLPTENEDEEQGDSTEEDE